MITYYGYSDGSGEYYVSVDSDKCDGCGKCIKACPTKAVHLESVFIDLEDKTIAAVKEEERKKIKYTCAPCKPEANSTPCKRACEKKAINCMWKAQ